MAFNGYLLKIGQTVFPLSFVFKESYDITPNRRQDIDPFRDANGKMNRNVVPHMVTTISIKTKPMWNNEMAQLMSLIKNNYLSEKEKKVSLTYYCPDLDDYQVGEFYIPDVDFNINLVDTERNRILYNSTTIEFIEY